MRTLGAETIAILDGDLSSLTKGFKDRYWFHGGWRSKASIIKKLKYKKSQAYKDQEAKKARDKRKNMEVMGDWLNP